MSANLYESKYCYRVCHRDNLVQILEHGLCTKHHTNADPHFKVIGNPSIISTRDSTLVRITGYGTIGEYVPFYFTPRSIMLYNIVTGYWAPVVAKVQRDELLIFRSPVNELSAVGEFFFTDGQANDAFTKHYRNIENLKMVDWKNISNSNFSKSNGDFDRPRRYQAEFLIRDHVPITSIESIIVYNRAAAIFVQKQLSATTILLPVTINAAYFFG